MKRILVSACLLGEAVRYDGKAQPIADLRLREWQAEGRLVSCCPECAAGLPTPRPPAECQTTPAGTRVRTRSGADLTDAFAEGARQALAQARENDVSLAILKERSPSCGVHRIYDGTFSTREIAGSGLTTRALRAAGFPVFNETELTEAAACLTAHEADHPDAAPSPRA